MYWSNKSATRLASSKRITSSALRKYAASRGNSATKSASLRAAWMRHTSTSGTKGDSAATPGTSAAICRQSHGARYENATFVQTPCASAIPSVTERRTAALGTITSSAASAPPAAASMCASSRCVSSS